MLLATMTSDEKQLLLMHREGHLHESTPRAVHPSSLDTPIQRLTAPEFPPIVAPLHAPCWSSLSSCIRSFETCSMTANTCSSIAGSGTSTTGSGSRLGLPIATTTSERCDRMDQPGSSIPGFPSRTRLHGTTASPSCLRIVIRPTATQQKCRCMSLDIVAEQEQSPAIGIG